MGRTIFEIGVNLVEMFLIIGFLTLYMKPKTESARSVIPFCLFWMLGTALVTCINYVTFFESIGTYIYIVIYFTYSLIALKGRVLLKLWMSIIAQIIVTMTAVVTNVGLCCIINYRTIDVITEFNSVRIAAIIASKIILVAVYLIILKSKHKSRIDTKLWYMLIIVPFFSVIALTEMMTLTFEYSETKYTVLLGMMCIVLANILTYYFYTVISKEYENKLKVSLLEQQYENSKKRMEESDAFVKRMKSVKHDIQNHLLAINGYIELGKLTEVKEYIQSITDNHLPRFQNYINTENVAFDTIVNSKILLCNENNIFVDVKVQSGVLTNFDVVDCGILFGNLLDNAIDAASASDEKRIGVEVVSVEEYVSILVTNSIKKSVLSENEKLETTKSNKELHGMGINSVRNVVKKYNGMIDFFEENGEFCCHILLDSQKVLLEKM